MIFVTAGTARCFRRFLDAVEEVARKGGFAGHEVIVQSGECTDFASAHMDVRPFISREEFDRLMEGASLVISHGGSTLLTALKLRKRAVGFPRQAKYNEHINDHQLWFVKALAARNWVVPAYETSELLQAVQKAMSPEWSPAETEPSKMPGLVADQLKEILGEP